METKIQPNQVKAVRIVTASDEGYIETPNPAKIDLGLAMKTIYKTSDKTEEKAKPTTVEEAKTAWLDFSQAKSRGQRRRKNRERKQAQQHSPLAGEIN